MFNSDIARALATNDMDALEALLFKNGKLQMDGVVVGLRLAIANGNFAGYRQLIKHVHDVNNFNSEHYTPLKQACWCGHLDIVQDLLARGGDPIFKDEDKYDSLSSAVVNSKNDVVKLLLERGIASEESLGTALINAAEHFNSRAVDMLLEHGCDVNSLINGETALTKALLKEQYDIVKLLLNHGADPNLAGKSVAPLIIATGHATTSIIAQLIDHGADINLVNNRVTPLIQAINFDKVEAVHMLIDLGADVDVIVARKHQHNPEVVDGKTALMAAAVKTSQLTKMILDAGADPNLQMKDGTALSYAATKGNLETALLLIEHGADINLGDSSGHTPLMDAAANDHRAIVQMLVDNGADLNAINTAGDNALSVANQLGHREAASIIECRMLSNLATDTLEHPPESTGGTIRPNQRRRI